MSTEKKERRKGTGKTFLRLHIAAYEDFFKTSYELNMGDKIHVKLGILKVSVY